MNRSDPNDGDEVGVDNDGNVICWDASSKSVYNSGEPTPKIERKRPDDTEGGTCD